jgi:hypothetical protein
LSGSGLTGLTGASANTYGNSTNTPVITVDANGRITTITTASISGGGGGSIAGISTTGTSIFNNLDIGGDLSVAENIVHTGDTDTKITFDTNIIKFDTNATERLRITSAGLVGIGTDDPSNYGGAVKLALHSSGHTGLTIAAGTGSDSNILFADGVSGDATYRGNIKYAHNGDSMRFHTAAEERLRITSAGNVGIGTDAPDSALHVITAEDNVGILSSTDNGANLDLYDNDTQSRIRTVDGKLRLIADLNNNVSNSAIQFYVDNSLKLHIDDNIGIGTDNPRNSSKLDVHNPTSNGVFINYDGQSNTEYGLRIESNGSGGNFESDFAKRSSSAVVPFTKSDSKLPPEPLLSILKPYSVLLCPS